jgi:hypothetical protein
VQLDVVGAPSAPWTTVMRVARPPVVLVANTTQAKAAPGVMAPPFTDAPAFVE